MLQQSFFSTESTLSNSQGSTTVNVASVPQRSPFRYPGGKTWFIPSMRKWLGYQQKKPRVLVEPFAGGANVALAAICENRVDHAVLIELDPHVAAVWHVIADGLAPDLAQRIEQFDLTPSSLESTLANPPCNQLDLAFQTILNNRTRHGGILAHGAGFIKAGEGGKGLTSRWYPQTLAKRLNALHVMRDRFTVITGDIFKECNTYIDDSRAVFFIDPPYTAGGKNAGKRLYNHSELDHSALFDFCQKLGGDFVMTYDNSAEVKALAVLHNFDTKLIPMKNTHHAAMTELVIGRSLSWL
jgi:DNA adenine methylase